jgi:UDP-N-acetylglucosamine transferase subunit ALG13
MTIAAEDRSSRSPGEPSLRYAVVTPVRDDARALVRLARALLRQSAPPAAWVIVDDGSTDETGQLARRLSERAAWISAVSKRGAAVPTRGGPIAAAFEFGVSCLPGGIDVVVKVDADVSMGREFFASLLRYFEQDPRLGIASGSRCERVEGSWRQRFLTGGSVEAMCRAYSRACLEDVLPFDRHRGWDGVDVITAQLKGWRTHVAEELSFRHHRLVGERDGSRVRARAAEGVAAYSMGYRPSYLVARTLYHAREDGAAAVGLLVGYAAAMVRGSPRARPAVRVHVRRNQRLSLLPLHAREVRGRRGAQPKAGCELLLVTEPGGHLIELRALRPVWDQRRRVWVTLESDDTRSLLRDETVEWGRGPTCRNLLNLVRNSWLAWKLIRRYRPHVILGTGSGIVVPFVWVGRLLGVRTIYIECGGRIETPSLSARLVAPVADHLYVQWPELAPALRRARYAGTVPWQRSSSTRSLTSRQGTRVFGTVGTSRLFPFDRLVRALAEPARKQPVVIQTGISKEQPPAATTIDFLNFEEFDCHVAEADLVVTHAGIGSVLLALSHGKQTIVMPRSKALGESVDDHQIAFATRLADHRLVTLVTDEDQLAKALATTPMPGTLDGLPAGTLIQELTEIVEDALAGRTSAGASGWRVEQQQLRRVVGNGGR